MTPDRHVAGRAFRLGRHAPSTGLSPSARPGRGSFGNVTTVECAPGASRTRFSPVGRSAVRDAGRGLSWSTMSCVAGLSVSGWSRSSTDTAACAGEPLPCNGVRACCCEASESGWSARGRCAADRRWWWPTVNPGWTWWCSRRPARCARSVAPDHLQARCSATCARRAGALCVRARHRPSTSGSAIRSSGGRHHRGTAPRSPCPDLSVLRSARWPSCFAVAGGRGRDPGGGRRRRCGGTGCDPQADSDRWVAGSGVRAR